MDVAYEQPLKGHEHYIKHLVSPDRLCWLGRRDVSSVAAIVREDEGRRAVGLMMVRLDEDKQIELMWLYVDEGYRGNGIARTFLKILFDAGKRVRASWISTEFNEYMMGDFPAKEMMNFLTNHGILTTCDEDGPWLVPGEVLADQPYVDYAETEVKKNGSGLVFFDHLSAREIGSCMEALASEHGGNTVFCERDISCAVKIGNKWMGVLMVDKLADTYEPRVFEAVDEQTARLLVNAMVCRLAQKITPFEILRVREEPRLFAKWMKEAFPNFNRVEYYLGGAGIK